MKIRYLSQTTCFAAALLASFSMAGAQTPLKTVRVASGLSSPLYVTAPAGDTNRVFIVQQGGLIKILKGGAVLPTPFLNIATLIVSGGERGLLGLAFHPNYANNGRFFVYYTRAGDGALTIAEYFSVPSSDVANSAATQIVITIPHPTNTNHNGGCLQFGPDGYLYAGTGDGGGAGDTPCNAQNGSSLLGKMLRLDVDGAAPYAIPPSNPFNSDPNFRDEIWAFGLRNPWRYSFDRATGDIYLADVGQGAVEEVDFQPASSAGGENYGWKIMEGNNCFSTSACVAPPPCNSPLFKYPIHTYGHTGGNCSITGGYVYRGCAVPDLAGTYFFADYCSAKIWSFLYDGVSVSQFTDRTAELAPGGGLAINSITSFGEDGRGEIYIVDQGGEVFQIVPNTAPCAVINYGQALPNSTGQPASIGFAGSANLCQNNLTLTCAGLPPGVPGIFFYGTAKIDPCVPFGNGLKCVGGSIKRLPAVFADANGMASLFANTALPGMAGLQSGDIRYFQFWYRDAAAGGSGTNTSDALEIHFCR